MSKSKTGKLRKGRWSNPELDYMVKNVHRMTFQEMGLHLNRDPATVKKYLSDNGYLSTRSQQEEDDRARLKCVLFDSPEWVKVRNDVILDKDEETYFIDEWINTVKSFGEDVWYTERKHLTDWMILDLKKYRLLKQEKQTLVAIRELKEDIEEEKKKIEPDKQYLATLTSTLAVREGAIKDFNSSLKDLIQNIDKIASKLHSARSDKRDIKANQDTYWGYITELQDDKYRLQQSRHAELLRIAQEKAVDKYSEYYQYADGMVDRPFLTPEIVLRKDNDERTTQRKSNDAADRANISDRETEKEEKVYQEKDISETGSD